MSSADTAIAGGGIIGLATALELAATGQRVIVFDRGEAMSEASRAAAGMLAGTDPEHPPELLDLARFSLSLYPDFLERIEHLSGAKVPIRTRSTLQGLATPRPEASPLSEQQVQELAPGARSDRWHFYLMEELSFDAWDLAEALPPAARAAGIDLREYTPVTGFAAANGSVDVDTSTGRVSAGAFLNATGAWARNLHAGIPVGPRKGHMLTVELLGVKQMQCVLRTPDVYIVPRGGCRYTIGPTLEDAGFDKEVYPDRIHELFRRALDLWPLLREARIAETWTGLRPASSDGLPIMGLTGERCWIATGHFKNGILLGPGTARVLSESLTGRVPSIDLSRFRLERFQAAAVSS